MNAITASPGTLRRAMRAERALDITYGDGADRETRRRIWPLSVVYFERVLLVLAHFPFTELTNTSESFRPRRAALLRAYLARGEEPVR